VGVLVTGGLGYVGSHAVKLLVDRGEHVVAYDDLSYGHLGAAAGSVPVVGDIGDYDKLMGVFREHKVDSVMHFAAFASVPDSVADPQKYYLNNVARSLDLIRAMLDSGIRVMIFSSSAATFGEPETVPIPEDHRKSPTNPYGRTKLMLEEILAEYDHAYGLKSVSLRYFNASGADPDGVVGEDHKPEHHLIPIVLEAALGKREQVVIAGDDWGTPDGTCIRDYVHVTDLGHAHLLALDSLRNGGPTAVYNMGNGSGYSVKEVIDCARRVSGVDIRTSIGPRRPGDPARLVASSEKIKRELGWKPRFADLETIISTAWNWHKSHPEGYRE
jgi:UDP-glucose 4-epimerase